MPNFPWLTEDGLDLGKFPIDPILRQALSCDGDERDVAIRFLNSMLLNGRAEAGIFLMGMLAGSPGDDLKQRARIVSSLEGFSSQGCADLLFAELFRVKSSNSTRVYLNTVLKALASLPLELIEPGFESLLGDKRFTHRMKAKFRAILQEKQMDDYHGFG